MEKTIDTLVLAENLFSLYHSFQKRWTSQSEVEQRRWVKMAIYVMDREAALVAKNGYKRALRRQVKRITERIEGASKE